MKLTIERTALLKALGRVHSVVERRNTIPILSNVKIEADAGRIALTATDMEIDIVARADAEVETSGATTAPAHTLFDIVRKMADGAQISMTLDGDGPLAIKSGRSRFSMKVLPTGDFPVMGEGDLPSSFALSAGELRGLIERTQFAISTEETRYYLNGVYLHAAERDKTKVLRSVATDGHRLASAECPLPKGAAGMPGVIVPRKAVAELFKMAEETTDDVKIELSETKIRFTLADTVMTSKLIDGTFPDYERVIPKNNEKIAKLERDAFSLAVDRVNAISSDKTSAVKLALSSKQIAVSANSPDLGSADEELEADYNGDGLEIGFNARYLLDIARQVEGDSLVIALSDSTSPTIFRDDDDASALYVLMPMRV
ncbi:MAG: DNA polymerase III subunit beta [Rhodospirillales bacterium]